MFTDIRSDAIIILMSTIKVIELPELTESRAEIWIQQDLTRYKTQEEYGKKKINDIASFYIGCGRRA